MNLYEFLWILNFCKIPEFFLRILNTEVTNSQFMITITVSVSKQAMNAMQLLH